MDGRDRQRPGRRSACEEKNGSLRALCSKNTKGMGIVWRVLSMVLRRYGGSWLSSYALLYVRVGAVVANCFAVDRTQRQVDKQQQSRGVGARLQGFNTVRFVTSG